MPEASVTPRPIVAPVHPARSTTVSGWLLIASFLAFLPVVALSALGPVTAALHAAAATRGIEYVNGALPLDVYAEVLSQNQGIVVWISSVLSVAVWVLFAVAIWTATSAHPPRARAGIAARIAAALAGLAWIAMLGLDVLLLVQRGDGLSGSYYPMWLGAEAILSAAAAASVLFAVLQLGVRVPRALRWILIVLAGCTVAGSLALVTSGGLPPIVGPLLAAVLGVGVLVGARRGGVSAR